MVSDSPVIAFDRSEAQGRLELADRDRLDLLHRMSTNDINRLQPGQGCSTVLTTALARIIDRVIVYHRGETALLIANQAATVRDWLQRHIFWQDRVRLRDVSSELGQLELHGPDAGAILTPLAADAKHLPLHHFTPILDGAGLIARAIPLIGGAHGEGYLILTPVAALPGVRDMILEGGAKAGDAALYEHLRIEAGLPGPGHELTEEYIPLEAGLWDSVSFSKGCYIGQEIIARMESRNRLAKTLVALRMPSGAVPGARLIDSEGGTIGALTSVAVTADGSYAAIGFVKPEYAEVGTRLTVAQDEGQPTISAEVIAAPRRVDT